MDVRVIVWTNFGLAPTSITLNTSPAQMILNKILFILAYFTNLTTQVELTVCYDNNSSKSQIERTEPRVFDVVAGFNVHVWCHYCNAMEDYHSRLWYYKPRAFLKEYMKEITGNDNGISITYSHILNINYFNPNHSGVYTCKSYGRKDGNNLTYILDGVINADVIPKAGRARQWQEYKRTYIDSVNTKFKLSKKEPFNSFRENHGIILNVHTVWDNWSECKKSNGDTRGIRKRLGRCRVSPAILSDNCLENFLTSYLTDGFDVPCRSIILNETIPEISKITANIPEFEAEETCPISLKPVRFKKAKGKGMIKIIEQVMENSHVTLICTDVSSPDTKWYKDKKLLKSLHGNIVSKRDDESHITLDANNSLHLLRISKNEEGVYTCSVNGKKVKQIEVKVLTKSNLLNQEFIRYSIYLGFVLSLTMTCYCAGVCVAWHRRASFVDPLNLYKKKSCRHLKVEREKLLGSNTVPKISSNNY